MHYIRVTELSTCFTFHLLWRYIQKPQNPTNLDEKKYSVCCKMKNIFKPYLSLCHCWKLHMSALYLYNVKQNVKWYLTMPLFLQAIWLLNANFLTLWDILFSACLFYLWSFVKFSMFCMYMMVLLIVCCVECCPVCPVALGARQAKFLTMLVVLAIMLTKQFTLSYGCWLTAVAKIMTLIVLFVYIGAATL